MLYTMRPSGSLRTGLVQFVVTLAPTCVMAEIGCYQGEASRLFLARVAHLTAVDPWEDYLEQTGSWSRPTITMTHLADAERVYDALVADYPDRVTKRKGASVDVAATLPDASFDLVYLDANHGYADVVADLRAWRPKVRPGGLLAGHDYEPQRPGVMQAVHDVLGIPLAVYPDTTWVMPQ